MVVWSSNLFVTETHFDGSTTSSECSIKQTTKKRLEELLKCYVCEEYYDKPRILPCGHSFCSTCLASLRENAIKEFNKTRDKNAHRRGDCDFFSCPYPSCHYSMKIMNVSRWALKNKALSKAVSAVKRQEKEKQIFNNNNHTDQREPRTPCVLGTPDRIFHGRTGGGTVETQTNIDASCVIITMPYTMFSRSPGQGLLPKEPTVPPPSPSSVMLQHVLQNTISTESLHMKCCRPPENETGSWKSYAFMIGMAVLDQFIKMS